MQEETPIIYYKMVFMGDALTGKISLINKFVYDNFFEGYEVSFLIKSNLNKMINEEHNWIGLCDQNCFL